MTSDVPELVARLPRDGSYVATWATDAYQQRRLRAAWSTGADVLVVTTASAHAALADALADPAPEQLELRVVDDLGAARALASVDGLSHRGPDET
jgi:hypothetical protein